MNFIHSFTNPKNMKNTMHHHITFVIFFIIVKEEIMC